MNANKKIAGCLLFVAMLYCASCRKGIGEANATDRLSLDSLATIHTAVIPAAIYTGAVFTSETTGYAISNNGVIIKTTDSGQSWTQLSSPASFFLKAIQFTNVQTCYVIGGDASGSYLIKTIDSGNNWTTINLHTTEGGSPTGLYFTDNNKGFITGSNFFLQTSNGGATWGPMLPGNSDAFYDVQFSGANTGIATTANGAYYKTNDGGNSWQRHETGAANQLREIFFAGGESYIKSGNKLINTHPARPAITIPAAVHQLYYINSRACIGIGQHYETGFWPYGDIYLTNDNWATSSSKKYMPDEALNFSALAKMSEGKFIMLGTGHLKVSVVTLRY